MNEFSTAFLGTVNIGSFYYFALDKRKAKKHHQRIPENSLLIMTLAGGTAGSLLAMIVFNHKTRKKSFMLKMLAIIAVQVLSLYLIYNYYK